MKRTPAKIDARGEDEAVVGQGVAVLKRNGSGRGIHPLRDCICDTQALSLQSVIGEDLCLNIPQSGDDQVQASSNGASMISANAVNWLYGFEYVRAQSTLGGDDTAEIAAVDFVLELDGEWT